MPRARRRPSLGTASARRVAALPKFAIVHMQTPVQLLADHAGWKAARSIMRTFMRMPTAPK